MPLKPSQILNQLNDRRSEFSRFDEETFRVLALYQKAIIEAIGISTAELVDRLSKKKDCGAVPLEALDEYESWILACGLQWENREQSNAWVREQLGGVSTFAVDIRVW